MEQITSENFKEKINATEFAILDFGSPGCAPCKKVPPVLDALLAETSDLNIAVYYIDITEEQDLARQYMVMGLPTIIILKNGEEKTRISGAVPKKDKLKKILYK